MTEEEKLAEEYVNHIPILAEEGEGFSRTQMQRAFLAGYEVGKDRAEAVFDKENIELKKRNGELAGQKASLERWLSEAKALIKNLIRVTYDEGWNYSLDWKVKAEEFLKED